MTVTEFNISEAPHPPHIRSGESVAKIMWTVALSLVPALFYAGYKFGVNAAALIAASVASAVVADIAAGYLLGKKSTLLDGSAVITGLIVALCIPPESPLWMPLAASMFGIIVVKHLFGGLGNNIFNPALASLGLLTALWPAGMSTRWLAFGASGDISKALGIPAGALDSMMRTAPLAILDNGTRIMFDAEPVRAVLNENFFSSDIFIRLITDNITGTIGDVSVLFIMAGGIFLVLRRIVSWRVPVIFIATALLGAYIFHQHAGTQYPLQISLIHLLSGGLVLGAFYMAADTVTSPLSCNGKIIYAIGCGLLASIIRFWGRYPDAVIFSILLMNSAVPLLDSITRPKVFGRQKSIRG